MPAALTPAELEAFARRIATRDDPPAANPDFMQPEAIMARLGQGLAARTGGRDVRHRRALARLAHALMQTPWLTLRALAGATGLGQPAVVRAANHLRRAGLLETAFADGERTQRLSRRGEDVVLALVLGTEVPT